MFIGKTSSIKSGFLILFLSIFCFFSSYSFGNTLDAYPFSTEKKKIQYQHLLQELRCLVCQNQSLAESNAPLAQDMRQLIYQKLNNGESLPEIKKYLVSRYSQYILLEPKFNLNNYLLWLSPIFLLGFSCLKTIIVYIKHQN